MKILVLEKYAEQYPQHLSHLPDEIHYAECIDQTDDQYEVLLAQPDLAATFVQKGGSVGWIQSTWAGVRPLADALSGSTVPVTGIKQVFGPQIAEYVFAYLLEELRQPELYRSAQRQKRWQPVLPGTLENRHMVIVGTGSIGSYLAKTAQAFGLRVTGVSRSGAAASAFECVMPVGQLGTAVAETDYVVLALPDTAAAKELFDTEVFATMQLRPLLLNVGRGASIGQDALLQALRAGKIRGAILDVFDSEPLPADSPLWNEPGVTITPHIAAVSYPADIAAVFLRNLEKYKSRQPLDYLIDLKRGY